jgi:acetylornithine deacetylase/succinyl-diaminopimelate desuccinylase-like protein
MFNALEKLKEFVRHPSVSTDPAFAEGMRGAREFLASLLRDIGFDVQLVPTPLHPIVLAHRPGKKEWPHIVIYGHYDVQPPDPLDLWTSPPFDPVVRDGRLFGRGAADDKGPLMAHIAGLASLLERRPDLPLRVSFLVEGEEEMGSPSFPNFLRQHRETLAAADCVLLSDTGCPDEHHAVLTCGLRGLALLDIVATGAQSDLHSGIHGGAFRNPVQALAELCASLHKPDGSVNIPGFYDDVLPVEPWERAELDKLSALGGGETAYKKLLGVRAFHTAGGIPPLEATRFAPTLEFNGIGGGYQGEGTKTVIPSKAFAKISCRLVPNQKPERVMALLKKTIAERFPADTRLEIIERHLAEPYTVVPPDRPNSPAAMNPVLAKTFAAADASVRDVFGNPPLYLREGGSVPIIADIKRVTGLDSVMLGLTLPADNLHAPNESFNLSMLEKGARASAGTLERLADGKIGN